MKAACSLVILLMAAGLVSAAPQPAASTPNQVQLNIDTRYSATDTDTGSTSLTISNTGNQTLQLNSLGTGSGNGVTVSCQSSCGASPISAGGSRSVTLQVTATEQASKGPQTIAYPITFSNAASITASIPVQVNKLEAGRLDYNIQLYAPSLPCPAPPQLTITGALGIANVGDTTISSSTTSLDGPFGITLQATPPSSLTAGASRSIPFSMQLPSTSLPPILTVTATGQYTSRTTLSISQSTSLAANPPAQFSLGIPNDSGTSLHYSPTVLGILEPSELVMTLRESCGYQGLSIPSFTSHDASVNIAPGPPWTVAAGQTTPVTLTVTIPLSDVALLCSGYSNQITFTANHLGQTQQAQLTIEAPVDLAGTRDAIQTLSGGATGLPGDLQEAATTLGAEFSHALGLGICTQSAGPLRDVLAAAPPISWAFNLARNAPHTTPSPAQRDQLLALGAMSLQLPNLCNGLASAAIKAPCTQFAEAYAGFAKDQLNAAITLVQRQESQARQGNARTDLQQFLARANELAGKSQEASTWRSKLVTSQTQLGEIRATAIQLYVGQQSRDQGWIRNPQQATAGDFRTFDPITYAVLEHRNSVAVKQYSKAAGLAGDAGDATLAQTIQASALTLSAAHDHARIENYTMLTTYALALAGAIGIVIVRRIAWSGQSHRTTLGWIIRS